MWARNRPTAVLVGLGAVLIAMTAAGLYLQAIEDLRAFVALALGQGVVYLLAVRIVLERRLAGRALAAILVVAALMRLGIVSWTPYLSSDVYRYVWDGRVQAAGINPYRYAPADPALASLRDEAIYPNIVRRDYARTIYPPAAQIIYLAATRLGETVTAMKLAMLAFEALAMFALLQVLRHAELPAERILIYAWHPLSFWELAGSGHVDAAAIAFVALALWARARDRPMLTGAALACGTLVKLFPIVLLPALYRRWDWRFALAFAAAVVVMYLPYLAVGQGVLGFLPAYVQEERLAGGGGFYLLALTRTIVDWPDLPVLPYLILAATILAGVAVHVSLRKSDDDGRYLAGATLLAVTFSLLFTPHYPWYYVWVLPLLCFVPYMPMLYLTLVSFVLYIGLAHRSDSGELVYQSLLYGTFALGALLHSSKGRLRGVAAVSAWRGTWKTPRT